MDVNMQPTPKQNRRSAPPGHFEIGYEFSPPLSGHLLVVTGHLHDYGTLGKRVDAATGKTLVQVKAKRDSLGRVLSIPPKLLAILGRGLSLTAWRRNSVVREFAHPVR